MRRRDFLATSAAVVAGGLSSDQFARGADTEATCRTYASPVKRCKSPRETELFVTALRVGIDDAKPDYLATVDVDPHRRRTRKSCSAADAASRRRAAPLRLERVQQLPRRAGALRRYLIVPGLKSGRIHVARRRRTRAA